MTAPTEDDAAEHPWPPWHRPALRWVAALDDRIQQIEHHQQRSFLSIANALEIQFEEGAVPAAVRHLLRAFLETARSARVAPTALGLEDDPESIFKTIAPKARGRGTR